MVCGSSKLFKMRLPTTPSKRCLAGLLLALGLGLLLSTACGTYSWLTDSEKPTFDRKGAVDKDNISLEGRYYYNPHKPYFRAIRTDNSIMTGWLCREVYIGCIPTLLDYPFSFVTDMVALPFGLAEEIQVTSYNTKHLVEDQFGPFTLRYRTRYGEVPYLEIYYKGNKQPINVMSYNLTIIEKQLLPYVALLVKTNTANYYTVRDLGSDPEITRVANDHKLAVKLPDHPNFKFLYRKNGEDSYRPCSYYSRDFSASCLQVADSYSYSFVIALRDDLTSEIWDRQAIERTPAFEETKGEFRKQVYLISLSPDEQQAVYSNQVNQFWLAKFHSEQVVYLSLTSQQLSLLPQLAVGEDIRQYNEETIKSDAIQRYKFYITWFNQQFEWYQQEGQWLIRAKLVKGDSAK